MRTFIGNRRSGLVFCKENGDQLPQRDILKYSLHPILEKLGYVQGGLNIFRRFRITLLRHQNAPMCFSTSGADMRKHTSRSATQNCFASVIFVWIGLRKLGLVLNFRRPQLATLAT